MNPLLIDFFCSAGGTSKGYSDAGFDVIGVDIKPQPRYPFPFILGDALDVLQRLIDGEGIEASDGQIIYLSDVAVIAASPPCQSYSVTKSLHNNEYPDLVAPVRNLLLESRRPYVIENVPGAPLVNPLLLCGTMFPGLRVIRHRLFECCPAIWFPPAQCCHWGSTGGGAKGAISSFDKAEFICVAGGRYKKADGAIAMGIDWMIQAELDEAIPPAYTRWLGRQMRSILKI